jgi:hypothetical protein
MVFTVVPLYYLLFILNSFPIAYTFTASSIAFIPILIIDIEALKNI